MMHFLVGNLKNECSGSASNTAMESIDLSANLQMYMSLLLKIPVIHTFYFDFSLLLTV